ncbi:MAG: hypothetical protein J5927_02685 [Oscillospiraceae bacterium]|nr:hypothetical protein [Oscillospiraceae bacterium]
MSIIKHRAGFGKKKRIGGSERRNDKGAAQDGRRFRILFSAGASGRKRIFGGLG